MIENDPMPLQAAVIPITAKGDPAWGPDGLRSIISLARTRACKICLAGGQYAWGGRGLDEESVASNAKVTSLLSVIPRFIPGEFNACDEVIAFDAISATVCEH
jgi:hypothetical protein